MRGNIPSKKKQPVPISPLLTPYLQRRSRIANLPIQYEDLLDYNVSMPLYDQKGEDTLWETVYYDDIRQVEIYKSLTLIYALLKTDGDMQVMEHLTVARIDFCTFGNTQPFRIRIINRLNDNYDHFYVKKADASRVYGLELEDLLSPNRVIYLVEGKTLIEEHVAGIPGDDFMENNLNVPVFDQTRIAKEFIKFNERCFIRLLGDMRAYNYVVDITPDIEGNQYRLRAIDFDQQSYEGKKRFYMPQYFKENNPIITMGMDLMAKKTTEQYQLEERSLIAARVKASRDLVRDLMEVMRVDKLSEPPKVELLKNELANHHKRKSFLKCNTMGDVVFANINLLLQKEFKRSIAWRKR